MKNFILGLFTIPAAIGMVTLIGALDLQPKNKRFVNKLSIKTVDAALKKTYSGDGKYAITQRMQLKSELAALGLMEETYNGESSHGNQPVESVCRRSR